MPVIGTGTDLVKIGRIEKAADEGFLRRYFTEAENRLFILRKMNTGTIAANFAAKEAFVKALGTGFREVRAIDIETLRDELGKPYINVYGAAEEAARERSVNTIHVSLAHDGDYAQAFVVLEK